MIQYIRYKQLLPIYKGMTQEAILIEYQEHDFIIEDRIIINDD